MFTGVVLFLLVIVIPSTFGQLTFFVVGDWGGSGGSTTKLQKDVANAMVQVAQQTPPSFIVTVGDNFYDNGVTSSFDPLWQTIYEEVYTHPFLQVPWYPVLGNRDYYGNTSAQIEYTRFSKRWSFPERNYQFIKPIPNNNGTVRFIMLDSYDMATSVSSDPGDTSAPPQPNELHRIEDMAFVLTAIQNTSFRWTVFVTHYPMYSAGSHGPVITEFQPQLQPLLTDPYPDVYFAGHDHSLQHLYNAPIHCYIVGGSGTKTANTWVPDNEVIGVLYFPKNPNQVPPETGGFVSTTVTDDQMVVTIYSRYGAVLHNFTHYPQIPVQPPTTPTPPSSTQTSSTPTSSNSATPPLVPSSSPGTPSGNNEEQQTPTHTNPSQNVFISVISVIAVLIVVAVIVLVVVCIRAKRVESI